MSEETKKEDIDMEEKIREFEADIQIAEDAVDKLIKESDAKDEQISILKQAVTILTEENKGFDKELTIMKTSVSSAKERADAAAIMDEMLKNSAIGDSLHAKVRSMLDYNLFRTEAGSFDVKAFGEAFSAEVSDWESRIPKGGNLGMGDDQITDVKPKGRHSDENKKILADISR